MNVPIYAGGSSNGGGGSFTPCPPGTYPAVCVDVVDLGMVDTKYPDPKNPGQNRWAHKIRIVWQVSKTMESGKPYIVDNRYTLSFNEYEGKKSNLLLLLESWGIDLQELVDHTFQPDVERLIGRTCFINVTQRKGEKATFANVASLMPLPEGMTAPKPRDYVRVKDREAKVAQMVDGDPDGDLSF